MTELQWHIVQKAVQNPNELFGIEPQLVRELHASGAEGILSDDSAVWLKDLGKRLGLIQWTPEERRSFQRFKSAARSGMLKKPWQRRNSHGSATH